MSQHSANTARNDLVEKVTWKAKERLQAQEMSLIERHHQLLRSEGSVPPDKICVGFILQNDYFTPYSADLLKGAADQYRVPIHASLMDEAYTWKRRRDQYINDTNILIQALKALTDQSHEICGYLPNIARSLIGLPTQDEGSVWQTLNPRQQRAFRTLQTKISMFQADDLLS